MLTPDAASGTPSPALTLFRADLRRIWSGRTVRLSLLVVLGILLIQLVVGVLLSRVWPAVGTSAWVELQYVAGMLGLHSPWATALLQGLGQLPPGTPRSYDAQPWWATVPLGIAMVFVQMLLPAFAALSLAPDRENRRLDELVLAGFTPRQLLVAKGLAALLPLLALWAATRLLGAAIWFLLDRPADANLPAVLEPLHGPLAQWMSVLAFLARAASLVCLSALCRRSQTAMQGCYAFAFLLFPLLQLAVLTPFALLRPAPSAWPGFYIYLPTAVAVLCCGVLVRLALRALADPGEPRSTSRTFPAAAG